MKETKTFHGNLINKTFTILESINCQTENIIYLIECKICPAQYIGESKNSVNYRLIRHRASHKAKKDEPVANHFNLPTHNISNLTITGIERINNKRDTTRALREKYWIYTLKTQQTPGLNIRD
jgi:hypothetical protein